MVTINCSEEKAGYKTVRTALSQFCKRKTYFQRKSGWTDRSKNVNNAYRWLWDFFISCASLHFPSKHVLHLQSDKSNNCDYKKEKKITY